MFSNKACTPTYSRGAFTAVLASYTSASLPTGVLEWATALVQKNVGKMYEDVWVWDTEKKRKELQHVRPAVLPF